ncbi:MAG: 2-dehydropantoate 2-reductase [Psychromonas sp.]
MWQIIGAGAIGCLWAANLMRIKEKVHLVTRKPSETLTLNYYDLSQQQLSFPISVSCHLIDTPSNLLICVKATQVLEVIKTHLHCIRAQQPIILMHNGMGCAEQVQKLLPENPIICATTANASLLISTMNIKQTGHGATYLGPFNAQALPHKNLATSLNSAMDNTSWSDDINHKLWLKLLINSAINPLTAIHNIQNGQLQGDVYQLQIDDVISEAILVAKAEQVLFEFKELRQIVNQVIQATAQNYSSMNRDIHHQRSTENDFIAGYLLKKASQHQIETPVISGLYNKIKALENH